MYCLKCGKEIKDDSTFCPFCGEPVAHSTSEKDTPKYQQAGYNARQDIRSDYNSYNDETANPTPTMKWYNFLIYAGLFLYAFTLILFFVMLYVPDMALYGGENVRLISLEGIFDIFSLVMGFRAIMIRQDLKYYKKNAGRSFIRDMTIWGAAFGIFSTIIFIFENGFSLVDILIVVLFLVLIGAFIYCNTNYFKNREYLFQN